MIKPHNMFNPILFATVKAAISNQDEDFLFKVYQDWMEEFYHHACLFSRGRLQNAYDQLREDFVRDFGYDLDDGIADAEQWTAYQNQHGYSRYEQQVESHYFDLDVNRTAVSGVIRDNTTDVKDLAEHLIWSMTGDPSPTMLLRQIDALWFSNVTHLAADQVQQMQAMLPDEYEKSEHWQLVRDAALMIKGCQCGGDDCFAEHYYQDSDGYLDVYTDNHITRGREQLSDLSLLCRECHSKLTP
jgi:hypothetical protein